MLRGVLARLHSLFGAGENGDGEQEGEEGARFVPSVLDASVRYAHGGANSGERELEKMEETARELERQQKEE